MEPSMNSSDDISKKMESMSLTTTTQRVIRRNKRPPPLLRRSPYTPGTNVTREEQKEEAIRIGVELSVLLAKAMLLLSDDIRPVLCFCFLIFQRTGNQQGLVVKRLVCVMEHVFEKYIKPKNGVYQDGTGGKPIHWELIRSSYLTFTSGFRGLDQVVISILKTGVIKNPSSVERCNLAIMRELENKLKSVNEEANGFAREEIESSIVHIWKDLFETTNSTMSTFGQLRQELKKLREVFSKSDEEILEASGVVMEALETNIPRLWKSLSETTPQVINQPRNAPYPELFKPLVDEFKRYNVFISGLASLSI